MVIRLLCLVIVFTLFCVGRFTDPIPPSTWPPVWHTWVTVNVVDASVQASVYIKGHRIAFDLENGYTCRYQEQILYPKTNTKGVDICNWKTGFHWGIITANQQFNCTFNIPLNTTLAQLVWPQPFLDTALYIGEDRMASYLCYHWVALDISLNGKMYQMDVWTSVDNAFPCQIVLWQKDTTIHVTWAFDGFTDFIPPEAEGCSAAMVMCVEPNSVCHALRGLNPDKLGAQLQWVCDPSRLNCTAINPYGDHYLPNTVEDHCDWAFNSYYIANRETQGIYACNFGGTAALVPPSQQSEESDYIKASKLSYKSDHQQQRRVPFETMEIQNYLGSIDLVCPGNNPY